MIMAAGEIRWREIPQPYVLEAVFSIFRHLPIK
jgi:hypothetical protein